MTTRSRNGSDNQSRNVVLQSVVNTAVVVSVFLRVLSNTCL